MRREQLQRIIFEVGRRFGIDEFFIVGSAAILAAFPDPPAGALTATRDVDVLPPGDEDRLADQISFVLGEASDFDVEHGFYAEGVTSATPTFAPRTWKERTIPVRVGTYTGHCMEPHDLVLSKLGAGREKDLDFARAAAVNDFVSHERLRALADAVDAPVEVRRLISARIDALFA